MNQFTDDDLIRGFEEFDEKLPTVAKVIVQRGIDFAQLNDDGTEDEEGTPEFETNYEVFQSIHTIFREMVECTSEMTADEYEHYFDVLLTACELVSMVNDGLVYEKEQGRFFLTPDGQEYFEEIEAVE